MELEDYLQPLDIELPDKEISPFAYGTMFKIFSEGNKFPELDEIDIVILGVPEERGAYNNKGCSAAANIIRSKLYDLFCGDYKVRIADIGNLKIGNTLEDTYIAVADVCAKLLKRNIVPIILGGSQDLTYAQYKGYGPLGQMINIVSVDSHFDLGTNESNVSSRTFLGKIIVDEPNYLFNYSNIGFQSYFVGSDSILMMKKLYFDVYRLGHVRADLEEVEPIVRNADMLSFDISSIRQSDAPGNYNASPNGFYGEEACQIIRYAGLTDKLSSIGFYEINPHVDNKEQTSHLVAQMIWYFIDGYYNRRQDHPAKGKSDFVKYTVNVKSMDMELVFYKSKKTDRWWMEIPYSGNQLKYFHQNLVSCSYKDYETACNNEIPERWWQAFHKFS